MRYCTLVVALAGSLLLTGCAGLISLNPIVTGQEARLDPALLGVWHDNDGEDTLIVKRAGDHYAITYVDKSSPSTLKFEARLLEVGDAKLLDVVSSEDDPFRIAAHVPMRVWPEGLTLRLSFLDSDWLKQQARQQLAVQTTKDRTLITAPSDAVRTFLMKYGVDAKAYSEPQVLNKAQ